MGLTIISMMSVSTTQAKAAIEPGHEIKFNIKPEILRNQRLYRFFKQLKRMM